MPLATFIDETMALLEAGEEEILVSVARVRRDRLRGDERAAITAFNDMMALA